MFAFREIARTLWVGTGLIISVFVLWLMQSIVHVDGYNARKLDNVLPVSGRHLRTHGLDPQAPPPLRSRLLVCRPTRVCVACAPFSRCRRKPVDTWTRTRSHRHPAGREAHGLLPVQRSFPSVSYPPPPLHLLSSLSQSRFSTVPQSVATSQSAIISPVCRRPPACCPAIHRHCSVHDHSTRHRLTDPL